MRIQSNGQWVVQPLLVIAFFFFSQSDLLGQDEKGSNGQRPNRQHAAKLSSLKLTQKQSDAIQVQMDTTGPIFEYATVGGGPVALAAGQNRNSKLQVFADGRFVVGGGAGVPKMEWKSTEPELIEFLNLVVNKNGFYKLDSEAINKQMGVKRTVIADGISTVFTIELQNGKHEVKIYSLWNAVKNFPNFDEIKRLAAIEKRCNAVITRVHLGDKGDEVLKLVNEKVAELGIGLAPFTLKEIRLAARRGNGRFQVSFQRALPNANGNQSAAPILVHAIYFVKDVDSEPQVTFYNLPTKK